jgi:hypothetical protein
VIAYDGTARLTSLTLTPCCITNQLPKVSAQHARINWKDNSQACLRPFSILVRELEIVVEEQSRYQLGHFHPAYVCHTSVQQLITALQQNKYLLLPRHIRAPEPNVKKKRPGKVSTATETIENPTYACLPYPPSASDLDGSPQHLRRKPPCCGGSPKDWLRRQSTPKSAQLLERKYSTYSGRNESVGDGGAAGWSHSR